MKKPKVKICAVARNEGYFLPQWVYHHFYMGFDAIDVYVNRSNDCSLAILDRLKRTFPSLRSHCSDWVDSITYGQVRPGMQFVAYAYDYYNNCDGYDYIMYLDIDEFFVSRSMGATIQDNIVDLNYPDLIFYEWICIDGKEKYTMPVISNACHTGYRSTHGKSVVKCQLELTRSNCHVPRFERIKRVCLADGSSMLLEENIPEMVHKDCASMFKPFFIIHDWMRSPVFFLSTISNGVGYASMQTSLDSTRSGKTRYNPFNKTEGRKFRLKMDPSYAANFQRLIDDEELSRCMDEARRVRILQALNQMRLILSEPDHPISRACAESLGDIESIFLFWTQKLNINLQDLPSERVMRMTKSDVVGVDEESRTYFEVAMRLYPYALERGGWPLFLSSHISALLSAGDFSGAEKIMSVYNKNFCSDKGWYKLLTAKAHEKIGHFNEALQLWRELQFTRYFKEAQDGLKRLAAHV